MNIYKGIRIPERLQTPEHLSVAAYNFANTLAAGRWVYKSVPKVEITRSIAEVMGEELELADQDIQPVYNEIQISFSAIKRYLEIEDGNGEFVPHYRVISSASQEITKEEISNEILDTIFEDAESEAHPIHDVLEQNNLDLENFSVENLDDYEIMRVQEDEYSFNHLGEIEDYSTNFSYTFNGVGVHYEGYDDTVIDLSWSPLQFKDKSISEAKPFIVPQLNEESVSSETRDIDSAFREFIFNEQMTHEIKFGGVSQQEHTRRLLGMISMLSTGFINLSTLKSKA